MSAVKDMASSPTEDECPICRDNIQNPSEPSPCCRKVFCQSCLTQSTRARQHCPYCRTPVPGIEGLTRRTVVLQHAFRLPALSANDRNFTAGRRVGQNIQNLLNQLGDVHAEAVNTALAADANRATTGLAALPRVPTQAQRIRSTRYNVVTVAAPLATAARVQTAPTPPAPVIPTLNASPFIIPQPEPDDDLDDMAWRTEISLMENAHTQPPNFTLTTFSCPYCQQDGLDDLDLRDHCNENHLDDTRQVVCPICVSLPHGDPQYYSRDFIGHLNLRHCYYIEDMTNIRQSDDINLQAAILMSIADSR